MYYPKNSWKDYGKIPGIYTAGELALVSSPLFREHRLRLYRLRISFILNYFICVSYLIVKDHTPVLRFQIDCDPNHTFFGSTKPGQLPLCPIYDRDMKEGRVDKVLDRLEQQLQKSGTPDWPDCTYIQVSPAAHSTMADLHMIRAQTDGTWLPTSYGSGLGLIDGYMIQDDGSPLHTFFVPAERREELYQALTWPRSCRKEQPQAVIPLKQRLERVRQGLPCSSANAVEPVRAFGAMHLEDYMAATPQQVHQQVHDELCQRFGFGTLEGTTFQEAAARVYQYCMGPNHRNDCTEFIACLILPLLYIYNRTAPVNQATQPALELLKTPFPSVLMGAAMAAGQPCLLQSTRHILKERLEGKEDGLQTTCWGLMRKLHTGDQETGDAMLFRLFIEPFAMMNQAAAVPCH